MIVTTTTFQRNGQNGILIRGEEKKKNPQDL
jgi:hypothetical protein